MLSNQKQMRNEPQNIIDIPRIENIKKYISNSQQYDENYDLFVGQCPCCGKGIKQAKFFVNNIYGGSMYPANDTAEYQDAWLSPVGSECIKRIPTEYIIKGV